MDEPFFGLLALRLKLTEDQGCATMWTDSVSLGFNPDYVAGLTDVELKGLLCKEVLHIAAGHPWRQDHREASRWNRACTQAVAPLVTAAAMRLPEGIRPDPAYVGLAAEAIYDRMGATPPSPEPPDAGSDGDENDENGSEAPCGASRGDAGYEATADDSRLAGPTGPNPGSSSASATPEPGEVRPAPHDDGHEADWNMALDAAARMQSDLPLGIQRLVQNRLKATVDWREVLRHFFQTSVYSPDYTWRRPNARYLASGLYMPTLSGQNVPAVVIVRDTSGSIGSQYLQLFNGELLDVLESVKPDALYVLDVDAAVHRVQTLMPGEEEEFQAQASGGGGTDFRPAFDWVEEQGIECTCLIYLTDLMGTFPSSAPDYPVLWAVPEGSSRGAVPPFGDQVELAMP